LQGNGGTIKINGGNVVATCGFGAAAIGGGDAGSCGNITISGGTVIAIGSSNAPPYGILHMDGSVPSDGLGIGGNGGNITISGGTVTATGDVGAAIGGGSNGNLCRVSIGSSASIKAYSTGDRSTIYADGNSATNIGYFVNAVLDKDLSLSSSSLLVYVGSDPSTILTTLTPPAARYRGFAFTVPGIVSSTNYNIFTQDASGLVELLRSYDNGPIIYSINDSSGYNAYNNNASNWTLPVTFGSSSVSVFVPVIGITGVSNSVNIGATLTLSGVVTPSNATYKTITWTVKSTGTTGATISGNKLSVTGAGTVTVTATINNGIATGTPFTKDFTITVSANGESNNGGSSNSSSSIGLLAGIAIVTAGFIYIVEFTLHRRGRI